MNSFSKFVALCILIFIFLDQLALLVFGHSYQLSHKYGWINKAQTSYQTVQDSPGVFRKVKAFYPKEGFKRYPEKEPNKPRILIVGDSFTDMPWVSNGEEWYSYIEREFPAYQIYVSGNGGYGNLQEFMLINDHLEEIDPKIVILQTCANDFNNNNFEAELALYPFNNPAWRPFWESDKVVYRLPLPFSFLRQNSFCIDRYLSLFDQIYKKISSKEKVYSSYKIKKKDISITSNIIQKIAQRVSGRRLIIVEMCGALNALSQICSELNLDCILDFKNKLLEQTTSEKIKVVNNGHFNLLGNHLAGEIMLKHLHERGL